MAAIEARDKHIQERRRKVTQKLRESKAQWESRVKGELKYQRFRQEPRPNEDRLLVVGAIMSIGALVLDWWVSSTTLESFAVQFGLPPWLLATVVSIIDAGIAVYASGYLAEGELRRERHQKLGLSWMVLMGLVKLMALFIYLQDQYGRKFALDTIPWEIWPQVLLILVVYVLLKTFGAGLWYLFAHIRHKLPLLPYESRQHLELKHKEYLDILRSTFSDDEEYQRYCKEHDLELDLQKLALEPAREMKPKNLVWERNQATKRLQSLARRIEKAKQQKERYQHFRQELETLTHSEVFLITGMVFSLAGLIADLFISKILFAPIGKVLFSEGDAWMWVPAVFFVFFDAYSALYTSGYSTRDRIEYEEHRTKGRVGLILSGVAKLLFYSVPLYIQEGLGQKFISHTILWGLVIGVVHVVLWYSGAGLWYMVQFLRHWIPLRWFGDEQNFIAKRSRLMGILRSTFESEEKFETHLHQHGMQLIELPSHDWYGDLLRRKQL